MARRKFIKPCLSCGAPTSSRYCSRICIGAGIVANRNILDRFMKYVSPEPNSGCWLWLGVLTQLSSVDGRGSEGYGRCSCNGKTAAAHRVAYELLKGPIPEGLELDHLCRVRCCVNPDHLEPVTKDENFRRGLQGVLRSPITHCHNGHAFEGRNVMTFGKSRHCRECSLARGRVSDAKRRLKRKLALKSHQNLALQKPQTIFLT